MSFPYLELGFDHILDPQGYDHILFVVAMVCMYTWRDWKHILVLVTAFTIGHSITLLIAGMGIIAYNSRMVELLIPISILISAAYNLFLRPDNNRVSVTQYAIVTGFGLIHGLGFSSFFRALAVDRSDLIVSLLQFNIGVEIGQLIIVALYLIVAHALSLLGICQKYIKNTISVLIILESLRILVNLLR